MNINTVIKGRNRAKIFKIYVDSTSEKRVLRFIRENLNRFDKNNSSREKFLITTPNPEQAILATKDKLFASIINSSTIAVPDGIGILQAVKFLSLPDKNNQILRPFSLLIDGIKVGLATFTNKSYLEEDLKIIHGRILFESLCRLANKNGWRIALLGGVVKGVEVAKRSADIFSRNFKQARYIGFTGPKIDFNGEPINNNEKVINKDILIKINSFKPHILFVGMTPPKQEKWIYKHLPLLDIGGAMVVGGSFDYISGIVAKIPIFISKFELEWIWRLLTQQGRIKRILTAFPLFPLKVYLYKVNKSR